MFLFLLESFFFLLYLDSYSHLLDHFKSNLKDFSKGNSGLNFKSIFHFLLFLVRFIHIMRLCSDHCLLCEIDLHWGVAECAAEVSHQPFLFTLSMALEVIQISLQLISLFCVILNFFHLFYYSYWKIIILSLTKTNIRNIFKKIVCGG